MSDLFSSYENTFGHLTADITAKIGRIPNLEGGRTSLSFLKCRNVEDGYKSVRT